MRRRVCVPPPAFIPHSIEYLRANPNAAAISPPGPHPLRICLTLDTLSTQRIDRLAQCPPWRSSNKNRARRAVLKSVILHGLPLAEDQAGIGGAQ